MTSAAAPAALCGGSCGAGRSLTGNCRPWRVSHSRPLSALPPSLSSRCLPLRPPRRHQRRQHCKSRVSPAGTVRAAASSSSASSLHHLGDFDDGGGGTPALGLLDRLRAGIAFIRSVIPGGRWWSLEEINGEETVERLGATRESVAVLCALRKMWQLVASERWIIYAGFASLLLAALSDISIPHFLAASIFSAQSGDAMSFYRNAKVLVLLCFTSGICSGLRGCFFSIGNLILVKRLREIVFSALLFQDISFFDEKTVGNLSSRLGADCQQVSQVIGNDLNLISRNVLQGSGALIYLFILSWPLALSTLAICFVLAIIMVIHSQYQKKAAKSTQDVTASANEVAQEVLSLIRTVRVFGTEKQESERYTKWLKILADICLRQSVAYGFWNLSFSFLYHSTQVVAVLLGGASMMAGHFSAEQLTKFILYSEWLIYATWRMADNWSSLMQSIGASEEVLLLMDLLPSKEFLMEGTELQKLRGLVEFVKVSFSYPSRKTVPVLEEINLTVFPHEVIAIVGLSGSGKSTLVNLILNLYEPTSGQMAPKKAASEDIGWQHGTAIGSRHNYKCNYCGHTGQGGGVSRLKKHLAGGRLAGYQDVQGCKSVPAEVKRLMIEHLKGVRAESQRKKADKGMQERIISGRQRDEDDDDEPDVPLIPEQIGSFEVGSGSGGSGSRVGGETQSRRYSNVGDYFTHIPSSTNVPNPDREQGQRKRSTGVTLEEVDPHLYSREHGKQTRIDDAYNKQGPRYKVGRAVAKWWHHSGISFNAANSPYYKSMIQEVQQQGLHVQPPSSRDLAGRYLDEEVQEIKSYIQGFKKKWEKYGCTLMCDGWSGTTKSSLINFLVYCDRQVFYHKSVDASDRVHNSEYILSLMREVVDEIGEQYIVQVVTDNGSAYKKAGEELMLLYPHLYWTPCAAHCVDLMLKEIGTLRPVRTVVEAGQKITRYIYNHHVVLAWMRESTGGELLRPAITRFATNFIALQSLLKHKDGLKRMFRTDRWMHSTFAGTSDGKEVEGIICSANFWDRVFKLVQIIEPLYEVLRVVDGDRRPSIGLVYAKIEAAKKKIHDVSPRYAHLVLDVVEDRWDRQMSRDLHMAAYYLHPAYHYAFELSYEDHLIAAFTRVVERLSRSPLDAADAIDQMKSFREGVGSFAEPSAIAGRDRIDGADWWFNFGHSTPILRKIAVKILSQTSSSSGCERNWSTFALIHTKVRNRLSHRRLDNLVYVHYNMRLRVKHLTEDPKRGEVEDDPVDIGFLRDDEDPMVAWVARATTERGEFELDEEADDPEDPPRPNTFLAKAIEAAEAEEGGDGDVGGGGQPHSSQFRAEEEDEVDLLGELSIGPRGGAIVDDDAEFERLMNLGPSAHSEFMREAQAIVSAEPRRKGSHKEPAALSQAAKGKAVATSQPKKGKGKDIGPAGGPAKGIVITEPTAPAQKKKSWLPWGSKKGKKLAAPSVDPLDIADLETLDPNAEETPPEDSPRLPSSRSHDSMTTGSPGGSVGGGDGDGGGGDGNVGEGGGGGGNDGDGGAFTAEEHHGGPVKYNRRRRVRGGGRAEGAAVDSDSYNTMMSDFERMSTNESVGSYGYGGHSYQPESDTGYSSGYSGYSGYATTGYPAPYFHPPPFVHVHVPIPVPIQQIDASAEDVQMASLRIVRPGCEVWDHFVREFRSRYNTMMTWDEFRSFVSRTKSYHLIGELPSESDESVQPQWGTYDPYQQGYWGY